MADLIERLDLAISPMGLRDTNEELMAEARARIAELEEMVNQDEAREQDLAIRIAELEAEVARLRGADLIVGHILALVPLKDTLRVGATGRDLIEWVKTQRDRAALAAPDTGGTGGE